MLASAAPVESETVALPAANGRIVAVRLCAADDIVPFARAAMDGYALRAAETQSANPAAPLTISVVDAAYAGAAPLRLAEGCAASVATGAPLPFGADAVVPFEDVIAARGTIRLCAPLVRGDYVFAPGEDAKAGDLLVDAGSMVTPGRTALLAAAGHEAVAVYRRPRIAIVSTGNEIVAIGDRPANGQIRNSNAAMLAAAVEADGALVVFAAHAADVEGPLREALERACHCSDLVITTGGASAGERDLVKRALRASGAAFAFESIALRPAKPTAFARLGAAYVAVLPGNPAAAYIAYTALVRGLVRRLAGQPRPFPAPVTALLAGRLHRRDERHCAVFGALTRSGEAFTVRPLDNQCSSLVRTAADANALIIVEPGSGSIEAGDAVTVEVVDWNAVPVADP